MKKFTTAEVRDLFNRVMIGEISFSEMVEIMNERVSEAENPIRKFKKGDRVRIKDGVSSKTHRREYPCFSPEMDYLIGKKMTIELYLDRDTVLCEKLHWKFPEDWLEPYEELKKGDLAIFWQFDKTRAIVRLFDHEQGDVFQNPTYVDNTANWWANAIKFESREQYEKLIKGEI